MKKVIILLLAAFASSLSAQEFVAGWDFDDINLTATSYVANWGLQEGSATASWTHTLSNPPTTFVNEFGLSSAFNDTMGNDTFSFGQDPDTGFTAFSQGPSNPAGEAGFQSLSGDDTFSLSFDGTNFQNLTLEYAYSSTGNAEDYSLISVDISNLNGMASATYNFTPTSNGLYDNFAITGTVVPEPSTYAAILGALALAFVAYRRRK